MSGLSVHLLLSAFISLFVVVDPFGTSAVFITLTNRMDDAQRRRIACKAALIAIILLAGFCLIGHVLLDYMSVSLPAFRVAGGVLLFVTAFRMVMGFYDPDQLESGSSSYKDRGDIAVFPLAVPLLAGPGTMTASLMFATAAHSVAGYISVIAMIALVEGIALVSLLSAARLAKFFGPTGNSIIARVMGILLAAMAIQFICDGLKALFA
jgi:multiple antibiotic resistance protein